MAPDGRDLDDDRPMAGHRYRFAIGLVLGSVVPVTLSIVVVWTALGITPGGFEAALVFGGGFVAIIGPYVVGWVRSYLGVVGAASALLVIKDAMAEQPLVLVLLAGIPAVAAVVAVIWFSLRLGHVWRPADARSTEAAKSSALWPYPYV